jgi:hypothetical protein
MTFCGFLSAAVGVFSLSFDEVVSSAMLYKSIQDNIGLIKQCTKAKQKKGCNTFVGESKRRVNVLMSGL